MINMIIVDDEEWICKLIRNLIPKDELGINILGDAANGIDGLDLCRKYKPDIVITDIRMPGIDGLELMENLKRDLPKTKVIIVSGYDDFSYAQKAVKLGAFDYILKPIEEEDLIKILHNFKSQFDRQTQNKKKVQKLKNELAKMQKSIVDSCENAPPAELAGDRAEVNKVLAYIEENYQKEFTLENAAEMVFLNKNYFSELFKREVGVGFSEYLNKVRMQKATKLLEIRDLKVCEIMELVGYSDTAYFIRVFRKHFGMTPNEYRSKILFNPMDAVWGGSMQ